MSTGDVGATVSMRGGFRSGVAATALTMALAGGQSATGQEAGIGPDQLVFSTTNMDITVSPGDDFYRYANGGWLDRVERPEQYASWGFFETMGRTVQQQMEDVLAMASAGAATAEPGSPMQQVGTFYNAYLDVAARDAAGITPIQPLLDQIDAVQNLDDLARLMGAMIQSGGPALFAILAPDIDMADNSVYAFYASAGQFGLGTEVEDVLDEPAGGPRITAYRKFLIDTLVIAGEEAEEAARIADLSIAIEQRLHAAKLTPAETIDLRNLYNPMSMADLQAQVPNLDLTMLLDALGTSAPETVVVSEPRYFPVLSALLDERSIDDIRDYARLRTIVAFQPYLTTAFDAPLSELNLALTGSGVLPPIEERALEALMAELGQPVGRLYVENFFAQDTRDRAIEMIGLIKSSFEERIPTRDWLTDETRAAAAEKLDALSYFVGYPDVWIDYSQVPVTGDLVADVAALSNFSLDHLLGKLGQPVVREHFSSAQTLPMVINAAYDPGFNGFEVPAAIIQAPVFDPNMDAAVNFCRMGAVIGHEMTHGFDRTGKSFDARGNMREWWQPADAQAFDAKAQGLIDQTNAYEVLPGLFGNGELNVGENMADLGGITLAHAALQTYLAAHPEENVEIDGLTPDQRCFLAWAQLWAWKGLDETLRSQVATDHHPPATYRAFAPLQHLDAFYAAFGIVEGDPMWLDPAKRVQAW